MGFHILLHDFITFSLCNSGRNAALFRGKLIEDKLIEDNKNIIRNVHMQLRLAVFTSRGETGQKAVEKQMQARQPKIRKLHTYKFCWVLIAKKLTHTNECFCVLNIGTLTMSGKEFNMSMLQKQFSDSKTQLLTSSITLPFTWKLYIRDAILFYIVPVIEPSSVCQVNQQTHLNLKTIKQISYY